MALHFNTLQVHAGQHLDNETLSRALPLYQTTCYGFHSSQHAADLFELKTAGDIYTRLSNPTTNTFEERVAALEGGIGALATASGHAAQLILATSLLQQGDNLVASPYLYGGTFNQFTVTLRGFGIECRIAPSDRPEDLGALINDRTRLLYAESIGNPSFSIPDLESLAQLAHSHNIPLVIDNTFGACGFLCRPFEHGADLIVESATKWIGGHGTAMGGVIVDSGNYDWGNGRFPQFTQPSEGYHGLIFAERFGKLAFLVKARAEGLRDLGCCQAPFNAYQLTLGLETLSLRVERECENALKLAEWFVQHPAVESVSYPGLAQDPHHTHALKYLQNGFGAVLSVVLRGSKEQTVQFVDALQLISNVANVGDNKTLIIQPAATTHSQLSADQQLRCGVHPTLLRISAGIEHIDDLIDDIRNALHIAKLQ